MRRIARNRSRAVSAPWDLTRGLPHSARSGAAWRATWRLIRGATIALLTALVLVVAPVDLVAQDTSSDAPTAADVIEGYGGIAPDVDGSSVQSYGDIASRYSEEAMALERTQDRVDTFYQKLVAKLAAAKTAQAQIVSTLDAQSPTGDARHFLGVAMVVCLGLFVGYLIERFIFAYRIMGPWFVAQQKPDPQGYLDKLPILALRVLLTVCGAGIASAVAILVSLAFYVDHGPTQKTAIVIIGTFMIIRVVEASWRMVLAPYLPNYRIPKMSNTKARRLFHWLRFGAAFGITTLSFCLWMESLGLSKDLHAVMTSGLTLITVLISLAMLRANHSAITHAILGGATPQRASVIARTAARFWAPLASAYFVMAWAEMTYRLILELPLGVPMIAGAYLVLLTALVVYAGVSFAIEWIFRRPRLLRELNERAAETEVCDEAADARLEDAMRQELVAPSYDPGYRMRTMEDLARRIASVMAVAAGFWSVLWIWNAQTMMDESFMVARLFDISVTAFLGYVAYHAVRITIDRRIEEEGGTDLQVEPGDEGGGAAAKSRLATLLPLFRNFLLVTITIVTVLLVLLSSGINVTPIFAGAGVVGLAIGFGAQTLVRDIFSGMFFLIDDAFRKGEYIDIGAVKGTVEKISVRSFQLRHHLGMLHTIPFGEVQYLTNFSRDWVMMKLPLRLTYDTDVEKVRKLIKNLGKELQADPLIGDKFLQPLKSQGVYEMEESAMILRVKFMTKPGEQWVIRKRVYAEIRELFEREGIKFAHREVTVHVAGADDKPLTEEQKKAAAGAVRPILDPPLGAREMALQDDR